MNAIKPLAETAETVTLSRGDFEAMIGALEDATDTATFDAFDARVAAEGKAAALADYLPLEAVDRLLAGESPVRVWREHRGMTLRVLATASGLSVSYLSEIETGKKPGSASAIHALALQLGVPMESLMDRP